MVSAKFQWGAIMRPICGALGRISTSQRACVDGMAEPLGQSASPAKVHSRVFRNDGTGHFDLAGLVLGPTIAGVANFGGRPMLIEASLNGITLAPYPN